MSTYWRFECLDHDPPIESRDEFTQHTGDEYFHRGVELARNRPIDPAEYEAMSGGAQEYFARNARQFLIQHPTCRIGLVSEYGERRALDAPDVPGWRETGR